MLQENSLVREYNLAAARSAQNSRFAAARAAIEREYTDECDICVFVQKRDEQSGITRISEETVASAQPCKLNYEKLSSAESTETAAAVSQRAKLFLSPEIEVKCGSQICVRQANGISGVYVLSGIPAVYPTHQEVVLKAIPHSKEAVD